MIQSIFSLVFLAGHVLIVALFYFILRAVGNVLSRCLKVPFLGTLMPLVAVTLIGVWAYASYATFETECSRVPPPAYLARPAEKPKGYAIETASIPVFTAGSFDATIPIRDGSFRHYTGTSALSRCIANHRGEDIAKCKDLEEEQIGYVVKVLPWEKLEYWWRPPIYRSEVRVEEIESRKIMSKASELIFGGGLVSTVMEIKGGDQDYGLLGCGYVSPQIGLYRPTLSTRPRGSLYYGADSKLIYWALSPLPTEK